MKKIASLMVVAIVPLLILWAISEEAPSSIEFTEVISRDSRAKYVRRYGPLWADMNSDGRLDLIFMNHGTPSFLLQNADHSFSDVVSKSGIRLSNWIYDQQGDRHGASCGDYDNDGDLDLYISHGAKRGDTAGVKFDELLRNRGDFRFDDVTRSAGTINQKGRGRSGTWVDYDNDGWLDLYATNFESTNVMYKNNGDGSFSDVTDNTGLGYSRARAAWADYDQDGHTDVAVSWPLQLLRNNGLGKFEDRTKAAGLQNLFGYGLAWGDADNDGDLDLFVVGAPKHVSRLFINDNNIFHVHAVEHEWGFVPGTGGSGAAWGDLDNDGDKDLVVVRSDGLRVFENHGDLRFTENLVVSASATDEQVGGEPALGDYDGDGYLDIALDNASGNRLLKNNGSQKNWLKIKFDGRTSNRSGVGAKVWLSKQSGLVSFGEYFGDSGVFRSMGCGPLHLGLDNEEQIDVRVRWPSGKTTVLNGVSANQVLLLKEQ